MLEIRELKRVFIFLQGLFPAVYHATEKSEENLKVLDPSHTHFIFVQGQSAVKVAEFRRRFINHIASIPIEMDVNATGCKL